MTTSRFTGHEQGKSSDRILCVAAADGYRCELSYSELFNRNDQQEFLLIKYKEGEERGLFRLFAVGDFFSDRAIKSVSELHLDH